MLSELAQQHHVSGKALLHVPLHNHPTHVHCCNCLVYGWSKLDAAHVSFAVITDNLELIAPYVARRYWKVVCI